MKLVKITLRAFVAIIGIYIFSMGAAMAGDPVKDPLATSTQKEALDYLNSVKDLSPSQWWPHVKPAPFLKNLKESVTHPMSIYPGRGTNFCGYGALTYLFLQDDPLGYTKLLLQLYTDGKASFGRSNFNPSDAVKRQAGRLRYKGILDIRPAEQLWYLTAADHFKGYLNIFNLNYDPGDEDKFWGSVNYAKFNRMVRSLLHYEVHARGTDLIRPKINDLCGYISNKLSEGTVVLFINNRIVHKKNHVEIKLAVPTHFVVLQKIEQVDDRITLIFWDYGGRTLLQVSPAFLKKIIFGITSCTKPAPDEKK